MQLDRQGEAVIRADIPETYKVPLSGSSSNLVMASLPATKGPFMSMQPVIVSIVAVQCPLYILTT